MCLGFVVVVVLVVMVVEEFGIEMLQVCFFPCGYLWLGRQRLFDLFGLCVVVMRIGRGGWVYVERVILQVVLQILKVLIGSLVSRVDAVGRQQRVGLYLLEAYLSVDGGGRGSLGYHEEKIRGSRRMDSVVDGSHPIASKRSRFGRCEFESV